MVRVVPPLGYLAVWLQNRSPGLLVIALGAILLIAAAVSILRPDKPTEAPGSGDPANNDDEPTKAAAHQHAVDACGGVDCPVDFIA